MPPPPCHSSAPITFLGPYFVVACMTHPTVPYPTPPHPYMTHPTLPLYDPPHTTPLHPYMTHPTPPLHDLPNPTPPHHTLPHPTQYDPPTHPPSCKTCSWTSLPFLCHEGVGCIMKGWGGVGCVMKGWGGSCRGGVGHKEIGWAMKEWVGLCKIL